MHQVALSLTSVGWSSIVGLSVGCLTLGLTQWGWNWMEKRFFPVAPAV